MTSALRFLSTLRPQGLDGLSLVGLLLTPLAAMAAALAAWRFGVDTGWTGRFFIAAGFLSHWQVWCAFAISAEAGAYCLRRGAASRVRAAL